MKKILMTLAVVFCCAIISGLSGAHRFRYNDGLLRLSDIIEAGAVKKDKQKQVYIDLGSSEGAYEGLHMGVYQVKTIRGKEARIEVGKLKIDDVEGDEISRCKVQSGAKEIKSLLEAGESLVVISID